MICRILIALMLAIPAFAQLQLGPGTNITATVTNASTIMAWVSTNNSDWHHYAKAGTNTYIDAVASAWSLTPWTYDGTNLAAGNTNVYVDDLRVWDAFDTYPTNGLVAYWSMRSSGTNVYDEIGTHVFTAIGSPLFGTTYGVRNDGYKGDGTSQYLYRSESGFRSSDTNGTISAWVKAGGGYVFVSADQGSEAFSGLLVDCRTNEQRIVLQESTTFFQNVQSTATMNTSDWYHVAWVSTGTNYLVYINGVAQTLSIVVPQGVGVGNNGWWFDKIVTSRENITIGARRRQTTIDIYRAQPIDEVAIFSRALFSNEVSTIYNSGAGRYYPFPTLTTNHLAHYVLKTAPKYSYPLSVSTNLLALAEPWDFSAGNAACLRAWDTENLGVAGGVAVATNATVRDSSSYASDATANGAPVHVLPDREYNQTPASPPVAGYVMWLDAQRETGYANGATITTWNDYSGNGYHATNAAGDKIIFSVGGINGRKAISFTHELASTGLIGPSLALEATNQTVFAVVKGADLSGVASVDRYVHIISMRYHNAGLWFARRRIHSALRVECWNNSNYIAGSSGGYQTNDVSVKVFCINKNTTTALTVYQDDVSVATSTASQLRAAYTAGLTYIGAMPGLASSERWGGMMGEIIVYPTSLSSNDMTSVNNYLIEKWGVE